jgi:SNF2 family DNA or RNA helicase
MPEVKIRIELSDKGDRIILRCDYFHGLEEMCKAVPGWNFSRPNRWWTYPLNMQTCRLLRHVFTDMLVIGPRLEQWAREAVAQEGTMRRIGKHKNFRLERVREILPEVSEAMKTRTYQRVGAAFVANATRGVLLADQPGLGKTIQTLAGIVERGVHKGHHLVLCPSTAVRITWEKEVRKWTNFDVHVMTGSEKQKRKGMEAALASEADTVFLITNPETARIKLGRWCSKCKSFVEDFNDPQQDVDHREEQHGTAPRPYHVQFPELFTKTWNTVTLDESHRFLGGIKGANKKTLVAEGLCRLKVDEDGSLIALSGTPIKGNPENFWGVLYWLDRESYGAKWAWAEQYMDVQKGPFGQKMLGINPAREKAFYKSLDTIMLRRTKAEVAPDLPPKQTIEHWCEPSPKQLRQYEEMQDEGEVMFGDDAITATSALAELTYLKQIATAFRGTDGVPILKDSCKWTYLLELLEQRGVIGGSRYDDGNKFVIASQFTQVIDAMADEFHNIGVPTLRITGKVSTKQRLTAQQSFQSKGGPRIMLLNTSAGGVAIDLDKHCDELFFMDETWVPDDQEQVEDRIHRVSRIHKVTIHYLYARGSIDERIAELNVGKDVIQKEILDARRGVAFGRRLLKEKA